MKKPEVLEWIRREFEPISLATTEDAVSQFIDNSIRYFNTHSAFKFFEMYDYSDALNRIQLSTSFKSVVSVYPATTTTWIWEDHPLWTILGLTILDNITEDLIMMSSAFQNYRLYVGSNFAWKYVKSDDPSTGGYLYIVNMPVQTDRICVVGTMRVFKVDDITSEYILDWILSYTKAQVKMAEGNTLRKSGLIGVKNDGQELFEEGKNEKTDLQDRLAKDGRWCLLARRV